MASKGLPWWPRVYVCLPYPNSSAGTRSQFPWQQPWYPLPKQTDDEAGKLAVCLCSYVFSLIRFLFFFFFWCSCWPCLDVRDFLFFFRLWSDAYKPPFWVSGLICGADFGSELVAVKGSTSGWTVWDQALQAHTCLCECELLWHDLWYLCGGLPAHLHGSHDIR